MPLLFSNQAIQMTTEVELDRPFQPGKNGSTSVVCSTRPPHVFATGGYDHAIHLWSRATDTFTSTLLDIRHTSIVHALLSLSDTSTKLLSGSADCSMSLYDVDAERVVNTLLS